MAHWLACDGIARGNRAAEKGYSSGLPPHCSKTFQKTVLLIQTLLNLF
jgi:hypothetical protein